MALKFIDGEPGRAPRSEPLGPVLAELRANPGRWAEIDRYPKERRAAASSRGQNIKNRYDGIETATRTVGDEVVLYLRAVAA